MAKENVFFFVSGFLYFTEHLSVVRLRISSITFTNELYDDVLVKIKTFVKPSETLSQDAVVISQYKVSL